MHAFETSMRDVGIFLGGGILASGKVGEVGDIISYGEGERNVSLGWHSAFPVLV